MLSELFDEEYLRRQYDIAEHRKTFAEGETIGIAKGRAEERAEIIKKMRTSGMTDEQIRAVIGS